jgi:anti-anti-sigma regulatory factor
MHAIWTLLDALPDPIVSVDGQGRVRYHRANWGALATAFGLDGDSMIVGAEYMAGFRAAFAPRLADANALAVGLQAILAGDLPHFEFDCPCQAADSEHWLQVTIVRDVTEHKQTEEILRRSADQQQIIQLQAAALRELFTPMIPISDDVMAMPLVGAVDTRRAQQVIEVLLQGVAASRARIVILDITGVPLVDTQVANALLQAARSVRLLGAQVLLTGIRPEVAQTLVGLGVDLGGLVTRATLQDGITYAMRRDM